MVSVRFEAVALATKIYRYRMNRRAAKLNEPEWPQAS
jgi:hypothetical protein